MLSEMSCTQIHRHPCPNCLDLSQHLLSFSDVRVQHLPYSHSLFLLLSQARFTDEADPDRDCTKQASRSQSLNRFTCDLSVLTHGTINSLLTAVGLDVLRYSNLSHSHFFASSSLAKLVLRTVSALLSSPLLFLPTSSWPPPPTPEQLRWR